MSPSRFQLPGAPCPLHPAELLPCACPVSPSPPCCSPPALLAPAPARADDTDDFLKPDNWEGRKEYWKVDAKAKTVIAVAEKDPGSTPSSCSKKKYGDFEMTFKVRLKDGKSGTAACRSAARCSTATRTKGKFIVAGPQVDVGEGYWGSLYGEGSAG